MTERFEVQFEPVRGHPWQGVPAEERFRRLLKASLRGYGLRAVEVRRVPPAEMVFRGVEGDEARGVRR